MADPRAVVGEWRPLAASPERFRAFAETVIAISDAAPVSQRVRPDSMSIVAARVALNASPRAGLSRQSVEFEGPTAAANETAYRQLTAQIRGGALGRTHQIARKAVGFDGELALLELIAKEEKTIQREQWGVAMWLRFIRTYTTPNGLLYVRHTLDGTGLRTPDTASGYLWDTAELYQVGRGAKNRLDGTKVIHPPVDWREALQERFDPRVPLGRLSLDEWQRLLQEPLDTTYILRNRGNAAAVSTHPEYRWADGRDIGTERGEMSVDDAWNAIASVVESATSFGNIPSPDSFTLTDAELTLQDGAGKRKIELLSSLHAGWRVRINNAKAQVAEAQELYNSLVGEMMVGETRGSWQATAGKVIDTAEGKARVTITVRRSVNDKTGAVERSAQVSYWRSIGSDYAVRHELQVSDATFRGQPFRTFENTHQLLSRDNRHPGTFTRLGRLPVGLEAVVARHPDIQTSFTYDKWYELLKRPLQQSDVIRS